MLRHKHHFFIEVLTKNYVNAIFKGSLEDRTKGRAEYRPVQQELAVEEARVTGSTLRKWVRKEVKL